MSPDPESQTTPRDHYSYTVYADPAMAESFDRARFSGPIGEWLADTQAGILREYAGAHGGGDVLDVGTGTGRAALILAEVVDHRKRATWLAISDGWAWNVSNVDRSAASRSSVVR